MTPAWPALARPRRSWRSFAQREAGMVALVLAVGLFLLAFRQIGAPFLINDNR